MRNVRSIFAILLILVGTNVFSQENYAPMKDISSFKSQLDNMSSAVQTIESDFIQEKNLSVLSNKIVSRGSFSFRKDNNIRWEYTEPYPYLIILSGGRIFIKEESGQKQYDIQSNKMFQEMNRFISGCIQGDILKNETDYTMEYLENDNAFVVKLVPNSLTMREMLNAIHITFDRKDLTVTTITMVEAGGDYTRIDFINKKLNTDIPLEKFDFN